MHSEGSDSLYEVVCCMPWLKFVGNKCLQIRTMLCWMLRLANVLFVGALQFLRKVLWMFLGDLVLVSVRGFLGSIL